MTDDTNETPFACNPRALTPGERGDHQELTRRLGEAVVRTTDVVDGYLFEIDAQRMSIADLAAWTAFERRCCPFFDFALDIRREEGPLTLRLTGRDGVKAF